MRKKAFTMLSLLMGFLGFSQTNEVYFKYDEAGNQRYRGPDANAKQASDNGVGTLARTSIVEQPTVIDEETFWKQVRLYPVPVNDYLTIDWTEEADGLIESVSLYQHANVHWKFQQLNFPNLNRQLKIDMTSYEWGVYIVRFTLKDGRVFSKNITKR